MHELGDFVLIAWFPIAIGIIMKLGLQRGIIAAVVSGTMFLPVDTIEIQGFFDLNKTNVISLSALVAVALVGGWRQLTFRPLLWDLPIICVCALPVVSTLLNGGTIYSAISESAESFLRCGAAYLLGRVCLGDEVGRRCLVIGVVLAGLAYAPFCLYEVRMSPSLHRIVYGYHQHSFGQTIRGGGYRPMVFMDHGLMVGLWMSVSSVVLLALTASRAIRAIASIPAVWLVLGLTTTLVLCKSTGATMLFFAGAAIIAEWHMVGTRCLTWMLSTCPAIYVAVRVLRMWDGRDILPLVDVLSAERSQSIEFRLDSEERLIQSMANNFWFGRGPRGFNFVATEFGGQSWVIGDSIWINTLTSQGAIAVLALWATFLVPIFLAIRNVPVRSFLSLEHVPVTALALVLLLFQVDCLFNAFPTGLYFLIMGSLVALARPSLGGRS